MTTKYKSFLHVVRIDHPDCEGLLDNTGVEITAKIDGTNAVVWYDADKNEVCAGSRRRQLYSTKDNANFYSWIQSDADEAVGLKNLVTDHQSLIIYGEWMGTDKFIGSIKTYQKELKNHMVVFDVFDTENLRYFSWKEIDDLLSNYPDVHCWLVPLLKVLDYPTKEDILSVAQENHAYLPEDIVGEGVVCKVPGWTDSYGHVQYGKLVINHPSNNNNPSKKKRERVSYDNIESEIVGEYLTDSEITKSMAKIANMCGTDEFCPNQGKQVGMLMTMTFTDMLTENIMAIMKKFKNPTINFKTLQSISQQHVRDFLGL